MNQSKQLCVFVLIDALGWRFLEGRKFLSDLLPYRTPLRTVLGFSSGAIPTILTGALPTETGHWNLLYYDPKGSPFRFLRPFGFLPDAILNHRITRKILKETGKRLLGLGRNFECFVNPRLLPWFNFIEKRNIYERGGITGAQSIFDKLGTEGAAFRVYTYHKWTDREILQQAKRDLRNESVGFYFIYLSEMDLLLHNQFEHTQELESHLDWYAAELREIFHLAIECNRDARIAIFSDHGMAPVEHTYDLVSEIEALGYHMPKDYLAVYDSTMARFWFFNGEARQAIVSRLLTLPCGRLLPEEELHELGIFFADRRHGELIFLMHPGWLMARSDFNGAAWKPSGMHGYHPDDPYSDAIFLCRQAPEMPVATIADVYRYMELGALGRNGQ